MSTTEHTTPEPDEIEHYSEHIDLRRFGGSDRWAAVDKRDGASTAVAYPTKEELVWALDKDLHFFHRPKPLEPSRPVVSMSNRKIHRPGCRFVREAGASDFPFANPRLVELLPHCKVCKP